MSRALKILALVLLVLGLTGAGAYVALLRYAAPVMSLASEEGDQRGLLAAAITRFLSTPNMQISIGAIDGALSSDATIRDLVISDPGGPWLRLNRARLVWNRGSLLFGRLDVQNFEVGRLEILRRPLPGPPEQPTEAPASGPLIQIPQLPLRIVVSAFSMKELTLGGDVVGVPAELAAEGHASLGRPQDGFDLVFDLKRLDAPGAIDLVARYAPDTSLIKLSVAAHEPAAGLVAHALRLPGLPPLDLDLNGDGTAENFAAKIAFSAGTMAGVSGDGRFRKADAHHELTLDLAGTVENLLPPSIAPIFAGQTSVTALANFGDDGASQLDHFTILARKARLDIAGGVTASNIVDGRLTIAALPDDSGAFRAGEAKIKTFDLSLIAKGHWLSPALDLTLHVADAALPVGAIGKLDAQFSARPDGPATDAATKIGLKFTGAGAQLVLADHALAAALGDKFALNFDGVATPGGQVQIDHAELNAAGADLTARGMVSRNRLDGSVSLSAPDLARYAALAGLRLSGALRGDLKLAGAPAERKYDVQLALAGERLATGLPVVDGLIGGGDKGGVSEISGAIGVAAESVRFDQLALTAGNASLLVNGAVGRDQGNIEFSALAADLSKLGLDVAGRFEAKGAVTGTMARPDANLTITLTNLRSMGRDSPRFVLSAKASDLIEAPQGEISVDGSISGKPAAGGLSFARAKAGDWKFSSDGLRIGSIALSGAGAVTPDYLADGQLDLKAGDLNDLSPLLLQKLSGALEAALKFSNAAGRQGFAVTAKGAGLGAQNLRVEKLDVDLRGSDLFGAPKIDGFVAVERAALGAETVPRLRLTAQSAPAGTMISLATEARGIALTAGGLARSLRPAAFDLTALQASGAGQTLRLTGTARIAQRENDVEIRNFALSSGNGRLTLDGTLGNRLDLTLAAQNLPLALARLAAPDVALDGGLNANARISGAPGALNGDWRVAIPRLTGPQIRAAGLEPVAISAEGRLQGDRTSLSARIAMPRNGRVELSGTAPLSATGALDVTARGALDAALINPLLADGGQTVNGRITLDARAQGAATAPKISGSVTFANGSLDDPLNGLSFRNISARLRGDGDRVVIESFSASTRNGGNLSASGSVQIAPDAGFPANLRINGRNAELVSNDYLTAVGSLALEVSGPLAQRPRISGRINFDRIDVSVADRIPTAARPLANLRFVDPSRAAQMRLALMKQAESRRARAAARGPAFSADLNLTISAPSRIFVRGHGMDAELGGELTVTGALAAPLVHGGFQLRRGTFSMAGKRFDFSRGNINFIGSTIPQLDFVTSTTAGDVTARIAISGAADSPQFAFTSTPDLPQDEVISRLLFASASGSLSPLQGLQLAETVAEFSGVGGGGVMERMRRSLGLDSLNVQLGSDGSPMVGANRYISNNINVGVSTGAKPADNAVTLGIDVTKRIRVQGEAAADGSASAGVSTQWEY